MKNYRLSSNTYIVLLALLAAGCGKLRSYRPQILPESTSNRESIETSPSVELITKNFSESSFEKSSFSFFNLSQNKDLNNGVVDIEFSDIDGITPLINTQINIDQIGHIADLGLFSCKLFPNKNEQSGNYPGKGHTGYPYKEDRILDPLFWLQYSDMYSKLKDYANGPKVQVEMGHCYIIERTNSNYHIIAAFHVKEYLKGRSIKIDEIEVFSKQLFRN